MKILAIESSAAAASVAVSEEGVLLAQSFQNNGKTHSRTILPMLEALLKNCELALPDMDVIAVAAGPGSFTGLRIGISVAKGLAWQGDLPCIGVSTLEAMAWNLVHMEDFVICPVMDARRNEVYNALFLSDGKSLRRLCSDRAVGLPVLLEDLANLKKRKILVGDGATLCYNNAAKQREGLFFPPGHLQMQSAWGVACAARLPAERGELLSPEKLRPVYLRLSQAERERLEREHAGNK
ncbi:MAG: tRNA (adenosine(37)-N6)-threonylcarbamoyltransferase complex dimerization subunit type 1 TsaB [Oscillospiraceae bacterium]|nr:tRNA (adenosine(37)-N6)-threonylcarbamoyltransferase complex dimerization subunit type 1 TsaB [Oscillospiraceae bacterium]